MLDADVIVIGSGIAGASLAALLAPARQVVLLDAEDRPGYHSTGRSAALFSEIYGNAVIRALTRASREFLQDPPAGFTADALIRPRGSLFIAGPQQLEKLRQFAALPDVAPATRSLSTDAALRLCPVLRAEHAAGAVLEPGSADLDVHALHQGYLRAFRSSGGRLLSDSPVRELNFEHGRWRCAAGTQRVAAPIVVNAAGAWADGIAALAGLAPLGLTPYRRTAALIDAPDGVPVTSWPMVIDIDETFYFKPDADRLLISPADETPDTAGDAQPDDYDVALAVERVQAATTLQIDRLRHRWAGLRTFAVDRSPVVGFAQQVEGFFWLAGQGGYGIQTAPALARAAAALLQGFDLPEDLLRLGLKATDLSPGRPLSAAPLKGS